MKLHVNSMAQLISDFAWRKWYGNGPVDFSKCKTESGNYKKLFKTFLWSSDHVLRWLFLIHHDYHFRDANHPWFISGSIPVLVWLFHIVSLGQFWPRLQGRVDRNFRCWCPRINVSHRFWRQLNHDFREAIAVTLMNPFLCFCNASKIVCNVLSFRLILNRLLYKLYNIMMLSWLLFCKIS